MPDVNVASPGAHAHTGNEASFYELVRVVPHDLSVLAGALALTHQHSPQDRRACHLTPAPVLAVSLSSMASKAGRHNSGHL